jgi:hypothetical protein
MWLTLERALALTTLATLGGAACSSSGPSGACERAATRECVGPGACHGGQTCGSDGQWADCNCGTADSGAAGAPPGTTGTGATSVGNDTSTGGAIHGNKDAGIGSGGAPRAAAGAPEAGSSTCGDAGPRNSCGPKWCGLSDVCWNCICDACGMPATCPVFCPTLTDECPNCTASQLACGYSTQCFFKDHQSDAAEDCLRGRCAVDFNTSFSLVSLDDCLLKSGDGIFSRACADECGWATVGQ